MGQTPNRDRRMTQEAPYPLPDLSWRNKPYSTWTPAQKAIYDAELRARANPQPVKPMTAGPKLPTVLQHLRDFASKATAKK